MTIEIKYPCGCSYCHWGGNNVMLYTACDEHRNIIIKDRLKELGVGM